MHQINAFALAAATAASEKRAAGPMASGRDFGTQLPKSNPAGPLPDSDRQASSPGAIANLPVPQQHAQGYIPAISEIGLPPEETTPVAGSLNMGQISGLPPHIQNQMGYTPAISEISDFASQTAPPAKPPVNPIGSPGRPGAQPRPSQMTPGAISNLPVAQQNQMGYTPAISEIEGLTAPSGAMSSIKNLAGAPQMHMSKVPSTPSMSPAPPPPPSPSLSRAAGPQPQPALMNVGKLPTSPAAQRPAAAPSVTPAGASPTPAPAQLPSHPNMGSMRNSMSGPAGRSPAAPPPLAGGEPKPTNMGRFDHIIDQAQQGIPRIQAQLDAAKASGKTFQAGLLEKRLAMLNRQVRTLGERQTWDENRYQQEYGTDQGMQKAISTAFKPGSTIDYHQQKSNNYFAPKAGLPTAPVTATVAKPVGPKNPVGLAGPAAPPAPKAPTGLGAGPKPIATLPKPSAGLGAPKV